MPAQTTFDGVAYTVEKLPNGNIRVSHSEPQFNPMHGLNVGGNYYFDVYPCQRHQYDFWNGQLPPQEKAMPEGAQNQGRPWWSLSAGERAGLRD